MSSSDQFVDLAKGSRVRIGGVGFRIEEVINNHEPHAFLVARRMDSSVGGYETSVRPMHRGGLTHVDYDVLPLLWGSAEDRCTQFSSRVVIDPPWIIRADQERVVTALHRLAYRNIGGAPVRLTIVGPRGAGKREAVTRFLKQRADRALTSENAAIPIMRISCWESTQQFYEACLDEADTSRKGLLKSSKCAGVKNAERRRLALDAMKATGVCMIIVDKLFRGDHPTATQVRQRIEMLDSFATELEIPIIGIHNTLLTLPGTWPSPWRASWQYSLEKCTFGTEFDKALSAFERRLPLRRPSLINRPDIAGRLYALCEGDLGRLWCWLASFAKEAILSADESIDHNLMDRVERAVAQNSEVQPLTTTCLAQLAQRPRG